jgi:5'-3' exonuclease
MKALTGDSSDSIPGIPGVGPKRALGLLTDYPSLTTLDKAGFAKEVEQLDRPTKKYARLVLDNWGAYIRNYMLIKLPSELVKLDRSKIVRVRPCLDKAAVKQMFVNLGFASLLARFTELWEVIEDAAN